MHTSVQHLTGARGRTMKALILVLTLGGLAFLMVAAYKAFPAVSWNTEEDIAGIREGRRLLPAAVAISLIPAALMLARGSVIGAALVALPGIGCALCAVLLPELFVGFLVYLALGPVALGAAIAHVLARGG